MDRAVFALLLFLGLVLALFTARVAPALPAEVAARTAPFFYLPERLGQNLKAAYFTLRDRRDWRSEALRLERELKKARGELMRLELASERLRRTLKVRETQAPAVVAVAPVVGEDPSGLFRRLVLGLGEADGLRVGMPVTSEVGLVGVIVETSPHRAVVRTIVDPESAVGVRRIQGPGRGVAYGRPPRRLWVRFPAEVEVQRGETLVTGALGGLFPEGIPVGRVVRVERPAPGELVYYVEAEPFVRFSLLQEVVVLRRL